MEIRRARKHFCTRHGKSKSIVSCIKRENRGERRERENEDFSKLQDVKREDSEFDPLSRTKRTERGRLFLVYDPWSTSSAGCSAPVAF